MAANPSQSQVHDEEEILQQRHLPHDLITNHILTHLPIKSLLRFKSVSKLWYSTISSHKFATNHFKLSPFSHPLYPTHCLFIKSQLYSYLYYYAHDDDNDGEIDAYYGKKGLMRLDTVLDDKSRLVGSCNGLVCLAITGDFVIGNPITGEWRRIRGPLPLNNGCRGCWGFGYVTSVDDYKVVSITEIPQTPETVVHVFSLRSNQWRRIDDELYRNLFSLTTSCTSHQGYINHGQMYPTSFLEERAVLVNEALYWFGPNTNGSGWNIIAFNLIHETFDNFPQMDFIDDLRFHYYKFLCVMGGCLSKFGVNMLHDVFIITMLKCPGADSSSIRLFSHLFLDYCTDMVGFTRTGKFFINTRKIFLNTNKILNVDICLGLIDPCSSPIKYTTLATFEREGGIEIANHVPSLISPSLISGLQEE